MRAPILAAFAGCLCLAPRLAVAAPCAGFADIDGSATFCAAVAYVKNKGVTVGCGDGSSYCPNDFVTRAQMALFMQRLARGGPHNTLFDATATVGGGDTNQAGAPFVTVAGGSHNIATIWGDTIGGGGENSAGGVNGSATIAGGYFNGAMADASAVGGGYDNWVYVQNGTIGGGDTNTVNAQWGTIGGGVHNSVSAGSGTVSGGYYNTASGQYSVVAGGAVNVASATEAAVLGGYSNTASGTHSTVIGGSGSSALADGSMAAGSNAIAPSAGSFTWADSQAQQFDPSIVTGHWADATNTFNVRATGGVWLVSGTDFTGAPIAGVKLAPGSGSWANASDRAIKKNFRAVDARDVLARIEAMPIESWSYIAEGDRVRHIGPVAQDFYAAFALGTDDRSITSVDEGGVALAAIQGLGRMVAARDAEITDLRARLESLERAIAALHGPAGDAAVH